VQRRRARKMLIRMEFENHDLSPEEVDLMRSQQGATVQSVNVQCVTSPKNPHPKMGNTECPATLTVQEFAAKVAASCDIPVKDMMLQVSRIPVEVPDHLRNSVQFVKVDSTSEGLFNDTITLPVRVDEVAEVVEEVNRVQQPHPREQFLHMREVKQAWAAIDARKTHEYRRAEYQEEMSCIERDPGWLEEMKSFMTQEEIDQRLTDPGPFDPAQVPQEPLPDLTAYQFTPWNARVAAVLVSLMSAGMRRQSAHLVGLEVALHAIPMYACLPKPLEPPTSIRVPAGHALVNSDSIPQYELPRTDAALSGLGGVYVRYNSMDNLPPGPRFQLELEWVDNEENAEPITCGRGEMTATPSMLMMHFLNTAHRVLDRRSYGCDDGLQLLWNGKEIAKFESLDQSEIGNSTLADLGVTTNGQLTFVNLILPDDARPRMCIGRPFTSCDGMSNVAAPATSMCRGNEWTDLTIGQILKQEAANSPSHMT